MAAMTPPSSEEGVTTIARIDAVPMILNVICRTTGMGFAAVARVTEDRWIACEVRDEIAFGLEPGGELEVETTICNEIRGSREPVVIDHVAEDPVFCDHPTPAMYGFQSYVSMPIIRRNGELFGTLCAIDPRPLNVSTPATIGMFRLFADLIGFHLDAQERLETSEAALLHERQTAELREQFIAVLGHDLRNPLASISAGAALLAKMPLETRSASIVSLIASSARRMAGLIDNVLDFARGRLGGGLSLTLTKGSLEAVIEQVIAELRAAFPDRRIESRIALFAPVCADRTRIGQLLSNLLANALTHGAKDQAIVVEATSGGDWFELSVSNGGDPIPAAIAANLFQPFFRAEAAASQQGLGLGLYIVAEIARAHGGTVSIASDTNETRFTFRMPIVGPAPV
jgi:signal transduction histidine kinase